METYKADLCGRILELPVLTVGGGVRIAFFNLHGDAELTEFCAERLAKLCGGAEVLLTAESKGLQLTHCAARNLGHGRYAVARKSLKPYMADGINVCVKAVTAGGEQTLYLSRRDMELLRGKNVAIIDDVVSTGGSLSGMEKLVEIAGGRVCKKTAVFAEGAAADRKDLEYLAKLPLL